MIARSRFVRRLRLGLRTLRHRLRMALLPLAAAIEARVSPNADGVVVASSPAESGTRPRILLTVVRERTAGDLARVTARLAGAGTANGPTHEVIVVNVVRPDAGIATADAPGERLPQAIPALAKAVSVLRDEGVTTGWIVRASGDVGAALRREARRERVQLMVMGWTRSEEGTKAARKGAAAAAAAQSQAEAEGEALTDAEAAELAVLPASLGAVLQFPPADVLIVGGPSPRVLPSRPLVLLGRGGDDQLALEHAAALSAEPDGTGVSVLVVVPVGADDAALDRARRDAHRQLDRAGLRAATTRVVAAPSRAEGALAVLAEGGYDAAVLATPSESLIHRRLFGGTQLALAQRASVPVLVVDARAPASEFVLQRTWSMLYDRLPKIEPARQVVIQDEIDLAAQPSRDFFVMIGMASAIAALGLVLNSPAVIIGAMLVAPLMSAIIAVALGIVEGNPRLLANGLSASARGMGLAVLVSLLIGIPAGRGELTSEMLARTRPGILDLAVALASGVAGAWALCRERVSASLPGVAIAVALVPPLATAGLSLAIGRSDAALGALLLFATNFVAIVAAGGLVFLLLGFGPTVEDTEERAVLKQGVRLAAALLVLLTAVLGWATVQVATEGRADQRIEAALAGGIADLAQDGIAPVTIRQWRHDAADTIAVEAWAPGEGAPGATEAVAAALHARLAAEVAPEIRLRLTLTPVSQVEVP